MTNDSPLSPELIAQSINQLRKRVSATEDELNRLRAELEWWETGQQLFGDEPPSEPPVELPLEEEESTDDGGSQDEPSNGELPPLRLRIVAVLAQEPRKTWKSEDVIDQLRQRNWLPGGEYAEHHVRSMLAEMHRKGQARRMGRGMYRLPPDRKDGVSPAEALIPAAAGISLGAIAARMLTGGSG